MNDTPDVDPREDVLTTDDAAEVAAAGEEDTSSPAAPRRRARRIAKRIGLTLLTIMCLVIVTGFVLYEFGSMEPPSAEMRAQYDALVASGQVRAVPAAGFHVPIPGCKCHSTDPVQQVQHAGYTIQQCGKCHGGSSAAQEQPEQTSTN